MQSRVARILKMTRHSDQLVAQMRSRVVLEPFGQCAKSSRLSQASGRLIMIHEKTTVHFVTGASGAFMIAQRDCPTDKTIHTKNLSLSLHPDKFLVTPECLPPIASSVVRRDISCAQKSFKPPASVRIPRQ